MAIVIIDLYIMLVLIVGFWFIQYYVKVDKDRHNKLLVETKEFALEFWRLPELNENYSIMTLKADLWDHIETIIKDQKQQILKLEDVDPSQNCEIIDI